MVSAVIVVCCCIANSQKKKQREREKQAMEEQSSPSTSQSSASLCFPVAISVEPQEPYSWVSSLLSKCIRYAHNLKFELILRSWFDISMYLYIIYTLWIKKSWILFFDQMLYTHFIFSLMKNIFTVSFLPYPLINTELINLSLIFCLVYYLAPERIPSTKWGLLFKIQIFSSLLLFFCSAWIFSLCISVFSVYL